MSTTTSEPPSIAYLPRSWDTLRSESLLEVAWRVIEWCDGSEGAGARRRIVTAHFSVHQVVGGDAGSNHHFRAAEHRVLGTLLGQSKLRITLGGAWRVIEWCDGSEGTGARRRIATTP